ncbi:MAG: hypothetical protein ACRDF4_09500, partial [Rhabdochlamydiaceae bacterium]
MEQIETYIDKRNESQTKKDVIEPILTNVLGHFFDVEFRDGSDNPDYTLFASQSDLEQAKKYTDKPEEYRKFTIGLADAKSWKKTGYSNLQSNAPIAQIHRYLTNHRRRWGFITNGNQWRLFAHKEGVRQDEFLEFNLLQILTKDWTDPNFKLFLYLFRREAFVRDAEGKAILDHVLYQSVEEAEGLREDLKDKVYEALGLVAEEFRRFPKNNVSLETEEERRDLKDNSLVFLYRILFLLYAESKLILPVPESPGSNGKQTRYYRYSLARLRARAIEEKDALSNKAEYWGSLQDLFHLIHGLDDDNNEREENKEIPLPPYNGGLFDPKKWPNLEIWRLGD